MTYKSNSVESERRIRAIIYYMHLKDPYFLLLDRISEIHPGWEFVKGGFYKEKDKLFFNRVFF